MKTSKMLSAFLAWTLLSGCARPLCGQATRQSPPKELVFLDTDIGDDIDDAFALGLLLESPELKPLGISTAFGDTELRARLVDRLLIAVHRTGIPVAKGVVTQTTNPFTQEAYAQKQPDRTYEDGVLQLLQQVREHPGEVTLIAIGPLGNIKAAITRDPGTFRKLKRVVIMSGSVHRGYGPVGTPPQVEWNAGQDPAGLRALLGAGVPVFVMPLDSTQITLSDTTQDRIFGHGSALTDQLAILYHQWKVNSPWHPAGPSLYDSVTVAYLLEPALCPMTAMRLDVDDKGMTRPIEGTPNAEVCLKSDERGIIELLERRLAPEQKRDRPIAATAAGDHSLGGAEDVASLTGQQYWSVAPASGARVAKSAMRSGSTDQGAVRLYARISFTVNTTIVSPPGESAKLSCSGEPAGR